MDAGDEHGQATVEHVGLVALIALVLLAAGSTVAIAAPSVLNRMLSGMQHALCTVTGEQCVVLARQPCPTLRTAKTIAEGATIASIHVGHDRMLMIERRSDGTYAITMLEGVQDGETAEVGVEDGAQSAGAEGSVESGFRIGRTYTAANPREARALVADLRHQASPAASAVVAGVADLVGLERSDPRVASYVLAGDGAVSALAKFGLGDIVEAGGKARLAGEVGVRVAAHERQLTAYVKLDASADIFFDALHNLVVPAGGQRTGASGDVEQDHANVANPIGVNLAKGAVVGGALALTFGPGPKLLQAEVVGYVGTEGPTGHQQEIHARLDPSDPAVQDAIAAWRRAPLARASYARLGEAAASSSAVDLRTFATTDTQGTHQHGGSIGIDGVTFGASYGSRSKVSRLLAESSRPVGGVWERRLDCVLP